MLYVCSIPLFLNLTSYGNDFLINNEICTNFTSHILRWSSNFSSRSIGQDYRFDLMWVKAKVCFFTLFFTDQYLKVVMQVNITVQLLILDKFSTICPNLFFIIICVLPRERTHKLLPSNYLASPVSIHTFSAALASPTTRCSTVACVAIEIFCTQSSPYTNF